MATTHRHVVNHTFRGGRFDDHGIDLDVLPDLVRYKDLLIELAKELWRRNNPGRERLPRNFEDSLSLRFYEVQPNCATVPLEREVTDEKQRRFWADADELDEAADLMACTIEAAGRDEPLPPAFPKRLLGLFRDYGKTLRDDEWIEQRPARRNAGVRYDASIQQRLTRWADADYEDFVDVTGEVTMARVSKPRMSLQLSNGTELEAAFQPRHESEILTALHDHATARLRVIGRGQFTTDGQIKRIIEVNRLTLLADGQIAFDASTKPIWEQFEDVLADVPAEELAKLPADGAERHDFYIYGAHRVGA